MTYTPSFESSGYMFTGSGSYLILQLCKELVVLKTFYLEENKAYVVVQNIIYTIPLC